MVMYVLKSAIVLTVLYGLFYALLSKETFHRFNRVLLLFIMFLSLTVPFIHFFVDEPLAVSEKMYNMENIIVHAEDVVTFVKNEQTISYPFKWITIATWIYYLGLAVTLGITIMQIIYMLSCMKKGLRHTDENGNTVVLREEKVQPFSIFKYIVMSIDDYENNRKYILTHEQEHIRLKHTYDLMLLEFVTALQWFNPFVWMLGNTLQTVHEYEADDAVLKKGINARSYQELLVIRAVGDRLHPLANNLNISSLQKRILMMAKRKSAPLARIKSLLILPMVVICTAMFAYPVAPKGNSVKTEDGDAVFMNPEISAEFIGGPELLIKYINDNLKYPQEAYDNGVQGRAMVQFIIEKDGSITNAELLKTTGDESLDAAAIEVVESMPKWKPAMDLGRNVRQRFIAPVSFRIKK